MGLGPMPVFQVPDINPYLVEERARVTMEQWVRDRLKDGVWRMVVVLTDWDPPSPLARHPDEERLRRMLSTTERDCVWTRTATQAASWVMMPNEGIDAVLIAHDVPLTAAWRVGTVAAQNGCQVWHQAGE